MRANGLTCKEVVEIVTDYLEGALSPEDRARFDQHLAVCDGCTNYLEQMRETIRLTGMLSEDQVPAAQRNACARRSATGRPAESQLPAASHHVRSGASSSLGIQCPMALDPDPRSCARIGVIIPNSSGGIRISSRARIHRYV